MVKLRKGEILVYEERDIPYNRNLTQKVMGMWIYPWKLSATNKTLMSTGRDFTERRIYKIDLENLAIELNSFYEKNNLSKENIILSTPLHYFRSFDVDGSQSDLAKVNQRGISFSRVYKLSNHLKALGFYITDIIPRKLSSGEHL